MSVKCTYEEQTYSLPCSIFHWLCIGFFSYLTLCISNFQPSLPFRVYFSLLRKSLSLLLCVFYFSLFFSKKYQHESSLKPNESLFDVGLFNSMKIWYVHKYYASHCHSLELVLSFIGEWWSLCMCVIKRHDLVLNNVDNDDYVNDML